MNYNKTQIAGHLTRDIEMRFTANGTAVGKFGIAVNREWKSEGGEKKSEVTFLDVEVWGKQAETLNKFVKKGSPLFLDGRLKTESWDDKQSGQKRSKTIVVCENFQFVGSKNESGGQPESRPASKPATSEPAPAPDDDQIPF